MKIILPLLLFLFVFSSSVSAQVVINEVSGNSSPDWIELYAFEDTDISEWILDDFDTVSNLEVFPKNTFIGPSYKQYIVIEVGSRLNNKGDAVTLSDKDGKEVDRLTYGDKGGVCIPNTQSSVGRYPDANTVIERFLSATKGMSNDTSLLDPCPVPTEKPQDTPIPTPTPKPTNTPTPTKKPSPTVVPTPDVKSETAAVQDTPTFVVQDTYKVGSNTVNNVTSTPEPTAFVKGETVKKIPITAIIFISIGVICVGGAFYPLLRKSKKDYNLDDEDYPENE